LTQGFDRANGPAREFPAAVRTLPVQTRDCTVGAERAFKRADHCVARIRWQIAIAALAVWLHEQHRGSTSEFSIRDLTLDEFAAWQFCRT
jgi:hypothetical protein